jgi:riboflavin kinase/FMN adenylyltransferase
MTARFVYDMAQLEHSAKGVVATLGTFDGIHRGHQAIFDHVKQTSRESGLPSVLVTFDPHPRFVVSPQNAPLLLTTTPEKKEFIPYYFDGQVVVMPFTKELMNLSAEQFVKQILIDRIGVKKLIVGYDHAFGKNRSGNITELKRLAHLYGFAVEVVEPVLVGGTPVSSTRIRNAILGHSYAEALSLLGHNYAIYGTVERGIGLGRKLGYPTANVAYSPMKLLPPEGVYACWTEIDGESRCGMMFIGTNHFNPAARVTVEANLFDFDRDIYDHEIVVYPTHFIRANERFASTAELVKQIEHDKVNVLSIISKGAQTCQ